MVLEAVRELGVAVDLLDVAVDLVVRGVVVEPELLEPLETKVRVAGLVQLLHDISLMDLDGDQGVQLEFHDGVLGLGPDHLGQFIQEDPFLIPGGLPDPGLVLLGVVVVDLGQDLLAAVGPGDLARSH